jgi:hypothetical protein
MPLAVVELRDVRCVTLVATCVCAHLRGKLFIFPRYFTSLVKRSGILSFISTKLYGFCYIRRFYQAAPFSEAVYVLSINDNAKIHSIDQLAIQRTEGKHVCMFFCSYIRTAQKQPCLIACPRRPSKTTWNSSIVSQ